MKTNLQFQQFFTTCVLIAILSCHNYRSYSQNSMTGDGFGGRSWYVAHNYQVGAYSAFTVCGDNNQLYGWGGNLSGELGDGFNNSSITPVAAMGMTDVKFYTTGYVSAVIKTDNTAWAWGTFGIGSSTSSGFGYSPAHVLDDVKFADAGLMHVVFVKNDSTVWGAGGNENGALGNGSVSVSPITIPVKMIGIHNAVRAIAVGERWEAGTIMLLADGTVKITGGGGIFQDFTFTLTTPVTMPGLSNIVDIKGNTFGAYALDSSGKVFSFGRNYISSSGDFPVLGLGTATSNYVPPTQITFPAGAAPIVALSSNCDGYGAMALDSNHNVYAWGSNRFGQLGDGTIINILSPKLVATNVIDIFAGENFSYILKDDNTLWATGQSGYLNIGNNYGSIWMDLPNIQRSSFTQIHPLIQPMNLCTPKPYGVICNLSLNLGNDTTLCEGKKITLDAGIDNASYLWQDNSQNPGYVVSTEGNYSVSVYKSYCTASDSIYVRYNPLPVVNLGKDTILCTTEKLMLNVSQANATYEWQDNSMNSNYTVTAPGTYFVTATISGCNNSDTVIITSKNCNCKVIIPNAITPNGDGINDRWVLFNQDCFRATNVFVYNRYGTLVYKKDNYQNDWSGTYKSKPLPDATYYYIVRLIKDDGRQQTLQGNLTILR